MKSHIVVSDDLGRVLLLRSATAGSVVYRAPVTDVGPGETPGHAAERLVRDLLGFAAVVGELVSADAERGVEHYTFRAHLEGTAPEIAGGAWLRRAAILGYHVEPVSLGRAIAGWADAP